MIHVVIEGAFKDFYSLSAVQPTVRKEISWNTTQMFLMIGLCCHNIKHQEHQHNTKHDFFCSGVEPGVPHGGGGRYGDFVHKAPQDI